MAKILSFSLDESTLRELELASKNMGFKNRSELVRAALRTLIAERTELEKISGRATAVAIAVHDRNADREISHFRHDYGNIVSTQIHHSSGGECIELFLLEGGAARIVEFGKALKKSRGVKYSRIVSATVP